VVVCRCTVVFISTAIDKIFYNEWTFVSWNFIQFNFLQGGSSYYGTHPWHWYITQGLPLVLFTFYPLTLWSLYQNASNGSILSLIIVPIAAFSVIPHKEFRFMMPIVPLSLACAGNTLHQLQVHSSSSKKCSGRYLFRSILALFGVTNALAAFYFGVIHQRGVIDVMQYLRQEARSTGTVTGVTFLMPCHSTPLYSHFHRKIPLRFITCEPPIG
jgi:phosphatidylinositol glycan class B